MSSRRLATALLTTLLAGVALAQSRDPVPHQARDVATLITRAELGTGRGESPENRLLRVELIAVQKLFRQALLDATQRTDSGALAILGAECERLLPRVPVVPQVPSEAIPEDWQRIGGALALLCTKRNELTALTDPTAKAALAEPLLERVDRFLESSQKRVGPTIRFPEPLELRPSRP